MNEKMIIGEGDECKWKKWL